MRPHPGRAIVAGFAATTAMTLALYALVSVLAGQPLDSAMLGGAVAWMPAMVLQFVNGSITLPLRSTRMSPFASCQASHGSEAPCGASCSGA
jgi:hypothetical protein